MLLNIRRAGAKRPGLGPYDYSTSKQVTVDEPARAVLDVEAVCDAFKSGDLNSEL
jgi:hypothetical protein